MAQLEKMIPFLLFWEAGVKDTTADNETLFIKARNRGISKDSVDRGGATFAGVTIGTYKDYCCRKGKPNPTEADLASLRYVGWLDILKTMFWDRWQADNIMDQRVAHMLVDWVWTSGSYGITIPQKTLGVKADGIVGPKTLAAVNSRNPSALLDLLKRERISYIDRICASRPANLRFRTGWLRRINEI